jgi:predicted DNA-binding transcriptional regulator AlpA
MTSTKRRPLTTEEVHELTNVSTATLRWWRSQGIGPVSYKIGRSVVYDPEDVERWIERRKAETSVGGKEASPRQ